MANWTKTFPPYEGNEPFMYLAFAEADSKKVWPIASMLLSRGCRIWYCCGSAGSADELRRRQNRAAEAALTAVYITDAACADIDTKSNILVNQKSDRSIICLDPDGTDRRLYMGLQEDIPHIPLYKMKKTEDIEIAIIHAEGFSQSIIGTPVKVKRGSALKKISAVLIIAAVVTAAVAFIGGRFLGWFRPEITDEVEISDTVILEAVREATGGGALTEEKLSEITKLQLDDIPESWDELSLLPALETVELPQYAVLKGGSLPEGNITIELNGGEP